MKRNMFEEIKAGIEQFERYPTVAALRKRPEYRPTERRIHETPAFQTIIPPETTQDTPFYYGPVQFMNKL